MTHLHLSRLLKLHSRAAQLADEAAWALASGSILGYLRHGDFVPHDHDVDVVLDKNKLNLYKKALLSILPADLRAVRAAFSLKVQRTSYIPAMEWGHGYRQRLVLEEFDPRRRRPEQGLAALLSGSSDGEDKSEEVADSSGTPTASAASAVERRRRKYGFCGAQNPFCPFVQTDVPYAESRTNELANTRFLDIFAMDDEHGLRLWAGIWYPPGTLRGREKRTMGGLTGVYVPGSATLAVLGDLCEDQEGGRGDRSGGGLLPLREGSAEFAGKRHTDCGLFKYKAKPGTEDAR